MTRKPELRVRQPLTEAGPFDVLVGLLAWLIGGIFPTFREE
jgi:hypothetical protein